MSQSEIDQAHLTVSEVAQDALIKPMEICIKDPAVAFTNIYVGVLPDDMTTCHCP